jgi:hypothetical protein
MLVSFFNKISDKGRADLPGTEVGREQRLGEGSGKEK